MTNTSKKMLSYLMINKNMKLTTIVKNGARVVPIENPQSLKSIIHSRNQRLSKKLKEH
jgi:hypothetical protein